MSRPGTRRMLGQAAAYVAAAAGLAWVVHDVR